MFKNQSFTKKNKQPAYKCITRRKSQQIQKKYSIYLDLLTFTEKSLGKQLFGRLRKRCENNVTMELKKVGCDDRKWMELVLNH